MNDVYPQAYLAYVLAKIANRHPVSKLDELLALRLTPRPTPHSEPPENIAYDRRPKSNSTG